MASSNARILLVESDLQISDLINQQTLEPHGYLFLTLPNSSQVIQQVAKFTPDLIIADLKITILSGMDLIKCPGNHREHNTGGCVDPMVEQGLHFRTMEHKNG